MVADVRWPVMIVCEGVLYKRRNLDVICAPMMVLYRANSRTIAYGKSPVLVIVAVHICIVANFIIKAGPA